ncbi:kinesin-like protein KIF20A-like [Scleropages formosus]|uniref:Kinesin-like protein n=1 Tax=Scleropages formosus TaxID=113540 RepID=A0A0P7X8X5_SCLFO|nr:kinesin-like protein KIF20A-like [Scleropages formosus]
MSTLIDLTDECTVLVHPDLEAMQSTCNGLHPGHLHDGLLSELSTISSIVSAQSDPSSCSEQQQLKVYLRVRPFSKEELSSDEDQGCIVLENTKTVLLQAPKGSATLKSSEKGVGQALHKFSFSKIFGPDTNQGRFFEGTIKAQVLDYLEGKNALVFTYGVTNAGKTYTIQGSQKDPGILPQALDVIFYHVKGKQYDQMDLKPYLSCDVQYLNPDEVKQERSAKAAILSLLKEENDQYSKSSSSTSASYPSSLSFSSVSYDQTADSTDTAADRERLRFAVWVSFYEIYNECVYDLLQPLPSGKARKRGALRVCEDSSGNSYIRDLRWINVHNSEEACKILKVGNKNRSAASTKMNQSSSRSIFTIKLLKIDGTEVQRVTELSLCDLAGSERCNKTKTFGERLKEAGNINNSLLILGKCIAALRHNQSDRMKNNYIPFRESKLTRLFQSIFCGKGVASMIVNVNQCASTYDETLHVMKFSAVAKQVVQIIPPKSLESLAPRLVGKDGKPLLRNGVIDTEALDSYLEEEELLDEEDEEDMSILPQEDLLNIIESLKEKLLAERRRNLVQEIEIRKEMGDAMLQQLMESEELRSRQMAELKESYQEKLENTFELYKDALKEHAYQCALERVGEEYVPMDEFIAEQEKVEELKTKLLVVEQRMQGFPQPFPAILTLEKACQCPSDPLVQESLTDRESYEALYEAKCAAEQLCEAREKTIKSLEKRVKELNETLQEAGESFMEKVDEIEKLERKLADKGHEVEVLRKELEEKDRLVIFLTKEKAESSQESPSKGKVKKGLLANIKESVTSPRKGALGRTLRKSVRTAPMSLKKKPMN